MSNIKNKIAVIGSVGIPANYGGFETFVEYFTKELSLKYDITVYCSKHSYAKHERKEKHNSSRLVYLPLNANGIQSIFYDFISMCHALFYADTLLILGVSGCIFLPFIKLFCWRKKIITNIDGLEWRRNKWSNKIKKFLKFSEKMAVKFSNIVIADNKVIGNYVVEEYKKNCVIIEYGGDHNQIISLSNEDNCKLIDFEKYPFLKSKYSFAVCRIEPENNLHVVLEAFAKMPKQVLAIVGNWNNSEYGRDLLEKYKSYSNIYLYPPTYDKIELNILTSNCYIYVHGHSAGGTNPSLVEAMNLNIPILAYDVNFNRETTSNNALFFSESNDIIEYYNNLKQDQLALIAERLYDVALKRYSWSIICQKYMKLI